MLEPPTDLSDRDVLDLVRGHWNDRVDSVEHLPIGFGAHHWAATSGGRRTHFVTLDRLGPRHDAASIEAAYAAAAVLAIGLDFVIAPLPEAGGRFTVPLGTGALSVTLWVDAEAPQHLDLDVTARLLARMHARPAPPGTPEWTTLVPASLADDLAASSRAPWDSGPYAERVRSALRGRLDAIAEWTDAYHALAEVARRRPWVVTHGEPHERNQLVHAFSGDTWLVDWESVKLAPAERDWRTLVERGLPADGLDAAMLDLFDLEWRLDEISQYAAWFAAPHTGSASDRVAVGGLLHELTR